ncbi:hypothetical protein [Microcoleus sp. FACHB-672]|uniref:hypothetical protein n=1 Tax=Microcoleus sp. FACHB-672 TaxID=2692825 RepID=UPI001687C65D|nr:hypothetical protein [Microcoleus sp. FACHB-672]MBD2039842.1 hypothetical protein [Microcoleus sp. FACHB-672]
MNSPTQAQINRIINDLELLIGEIENNPDLSKWVVRMALKSIKEKAVKSAAPAAPTTIYLQQRALWN